MRFKKYIFLTLLVCLLIIPTYVYASLFYDLDGSTDVSWAPNGVNIYAISFTDDDVDTIQVYTRIYDDYTYIGFIINALDDASSVSVSNSPSYYGFIEAWTKHNATDWTGDEETTSYDSYNR